jgi:hypothetical protein
MLKYKVADAVNDRIAAADSNAFMNHYLGFPNS